MSHQSFNWPFNYCKERGWHCLPLVGKWTPGVAERLVKQLQVRLEAEPTCLNFPGQPSFHYSVSSSLPIVVEDLLCAPERVGRPTIGDLDPLSRMSSIPTHTHTHRTCSASKLGGLIFTPENQAISSLHSLLSQHRPTGRKGKMWRSLS